MSLTLEAVGEAHCVPIAWREVFPAPLHPLCRFLLPRPLQGLMSGSRSQAEFLLRQCSCQPEVRVQPDSGPCTPLEH